jgi:hypothetical protein
MEADALKRMETKLDRILELLEDMTLGSDEIELIKESDHIVQTRQFDKLVRL